MPCAMRISTRHLGAELQATQTSCLPPNNSKTCRQKLFDRHDDPAITPTHDLLRTTSITPSVEILQWLPLTKYLDKCRCTFHMYTT